MEKQHLKSILTVCKSLPCWVPYLKTKYWLDCSKTVTAPMRMTTFLWWIRVSGEKAQGRRRPLPPLLPPIIPLPPPSVASTETTTGVLCRWGSRPVMLIEIFLVFCSFICSLSKLDWRTFIYFFICICICNINKPVYAKQVKHVTGIQDSEKLQDKNVIFMSWFISYYMLRKVTEIHYSYSVPGVVR